MGGDTPLDFAHGLGEELGLDEDTFIGNLEDHEKSQVRRAWAGFDPLGFITRYSKKWGLSYENESVLCQVVAYAALESGCPLSPEHKDVLTEGAKRDVWATEDSRRREHIDALVIALQNYDGTPVDLENVGLIESILGGENE